MGNVSKKGEIILPSVATIKVWSLVRDIYMSQIPIWKFPHKICLILLFYHIWLRVDPTWLDSLLKFKFVNGRKKTSFELEVRGEGELANYYNQQKFLVTHPKAWLF